MTKYDRLLLELLETLNTNLERIANALESDQNKEKEANLP